MKKKSLIQYLVDCGLILYNEEYYNSIILNQKWFLEVVLELLNSRELESSKGLLSTNNIKKILQYRLEKSDELPFLIDTLLKTKICFCKEREEYQKVKNPTFVFPLYLSNFKNYDSKIYESEEFIHFECLIDTVNPYHFNDLIFHFNKNTKSKVYYSNFLNIFYDKEEETEAYIYFDSNIKKVSVHIKGNLKKQFLSEIYRKLSEVFDYSNITNKSFSIDGINFYTSFEINTIIRLELQKTKMEEEYYEGLINQSKPIEISKSLTYSLATELKESIGYII